MDRPAHRPLQGPSKRAVRLPDVRVREDEFERLQAKLLELHAKGEIHDRWTELYRWAFVQAGILGEDSLPPRPRRAKLPK